MREPFLILHLIGLVMGVGVSFTHLFLGISRSKMKPEEAQKDALRSMSLAIMGDIGITLLIVSGLFLMKPHWPVLWDKPFLVAKLSLVLILIGLLIVIRLNAIKLVKKQSAEAAKRIKMLGQFTLPIGIIIIILAVLTFK